MNYYIRGYMNKEGDDKGSWLQRFWASVMPTPPGMARTVTTHELEQRRKERERARAEAAAEAARKQKEQQNISGTPKTVTPTAGDWKSMINPDQEQ